MPIKLTFENIIEETLKGFPEYKDTENYKNNDDKLNYSFFSGFTQYVMSFIANSSDPYTDKTVKLAFDLFNEIIESDDEKLSELGVIEIIEGLVQEKKSKEVAEKLLREKGRKYIDEVLKYTGVNEKK